MKPESVRDDIYANRPGGHGIGLGDRLGEESGVASSSLALLSSAMQIIMICIRRIVLLNAISDRSESAA